MGSLANILFQALGGKVTDVIANQLGIDSKMGRMAIMAAVPLIISAISRNAGSKRGAKSLNKAIKRDHDGSIMGDLGGVFAGTSQHARAKDGDGILGHVFGNKRGVVENSVAQASGLDAGSVGQLFKMLAPVVMGAIGKQKREQNLDSFGMATNLGMERAQAEKQLGGFAKILDSDGDGQIGDDLLKLGAKLFLR